MNGPQRSFLLVALPVTAWLFAVSFCEWGEVPCDRIILKLRPDAQPTPEEIQQAVQAVQVDSDRLAHFTALLVDQNPAFGDLMLKDPEAAMKVVRATMDPYYTVHGRPTAPPAMCFGIAQGKLVSQVGTVSFGILLPLILISLTIFLWLGRFSKGRAWPFHV